MAARIRLHCIRWASVAALLASSSAALAQGARDVPREAEDLYKQAVTAMIRKDYATACPRFEQVTRIVPDGGGVRLNLAQCYEDWGRLGSAIAQYTVAQALAEKDNRKDRLKTASKGIERLKPRAATLMIEIPGTVRSAPELAIKLDGDALAEKQWGVPTPVDKGPHTLVVTAKGYKPATVQVDVPKDGAAVNASIPALEPAPEEPRVAPAATVPPPVTNTVIVREEGVFTPQVRTAAVIGGGVFALGGLAAGGIMLGVSFAKGDERQKAESDPKGRDPAQAAAQAESTALNAALWCLVGGGAAAVGTGVFYLVTRPRAKAPVKAGAFVGPAGPSIWVQGQF